MTTGSFMIEKDISLKLSMNVIEQTKIAENYCCSNTCLQGKAEPQISVSADWHHKPVDCIPYDTSPN